MNKVYLFFFIVVLSSSSAMGQGEFEVNSNRELVWTKIYDENLNIETQKINLSCETRGVGIYLRDIAQAKMIVQHKDNRTRVLVKNIMYKSSSGTSLFDTETTLEPIEGVIVKRRNGKLRPVFFKRDAKPLDDIIERAVNAAIEEGKW